MAKSSNQKLKQLYLLKILFEKTDEAHPMKAGDLIEELAAFDVVAERKSIYSDIEELIHYGADIVLNPSRTSGGYYMASRDFELAELKLLVDAVQSSKFITAKKSEKLIKKIEGLSSKYDAGQLQRQVYVANRIKTQNESIYYNVDYIHKAIQQNVQISFQYSEWTLDKEMKPRKDGVRYQVSPWALLWDDENYYLIAYDDAKDQKKHFRVDKMTAIQITEEKRSVVTQTFDAALYSKKMFGMFGGEETAVTLKCANQLIGVLIDRFGKEIMIQKISDDCFKTRVNVAVSGQFYGWITALGKGIEIMSPTSVREEYKIFLNEIRNTYQ